MRFRSMISVGFGMLALSTAACGVSADATGSSSQAETTATTPVYLALGDSIAFGEDGWIPWTLPGSTAGNPVRADSAQFVGYPFYVARTTYGSEGDVTDMGCPGETTGSFLSATAADNGCREYKGFGGGDGAWLHTSYAGTQMEAAVAYLAANPVDLITINLGGNDLLLAEYACDAASNFDTCVAESIPGVITNAAENMKTIMQTIYNTGYRGPIVYLTQYATSYTDATQLASIPLFNTAVSAAAQLNLGQRVHIASGFDTFFDDSISLTNFGNVCEAGLIIPNPDGGVANGCNEHPTVAGAEALAHAVVAAVY